MKKYITAIIFIICIAAACNTTKITSTWREPNKEVVEATLKKVLVVALFKNETNRHKAEDQMVGYLNGKGITSYNYFAANIDTKNENLIRDKIKADGFDGAITMRLIDVDKEKNYQQVNRNYYPIYYDGFDNYLSRNMLLYNMPGYYTTTKTYLVETNVYSIKEGKIIWSGLTETTNPDGVEKMTAEIIKVLYKKMLAEGFISKKN